MDLSNENQYFTVPLRETTISIAQYMALVQMDEKTILHCAIKRDIYLKYIIIRYWEDLDNSFH